MRFDPEELSRRIVSEGTPNQDSTMESISRRLYHKKLHPTMQIFYHGVYLIFLSDLLLSLY
jgi:hypothetical protein